MVFSYFMRKTIYFAPSQTTINTMMYSSVPCQQWTSHNLRASVFHYFSTFAFDSLYFYFRFINTVFTSANTSSTALSALILKKICFSARVTNFVIKPIKLDLKDGSNQLPKGLYKVDSFIHLWTFAFISFYHWLWLLMEGDQSEMCFSFHFNCFPLSSLLFAQDIKTWNIELTSQAESPKHIHGEDSS